VPLLGQVALIWRFVSFLGLCRRIACHYHQEASSSPNISVLVPQVYCLLLSGFACHVMCISSLVLNFKNSVTHDFMEQIEIMMLYSLPSFYAM